MNLAAVTRTLYRLYGVGLLAMAILTAGWLTEGFAISTVTVGYGWFVLAVVGGIVLIALAASTYLTDQDFFYTAGAESRMTRFEQSVLSRTPLVLYAIGLVLWGVITVGWVLGTPSTPISTGPQTSQFVFETIRSPGTGLSVTTVSIGWGLIALYGFVLTIGLTIRHQDHLQEAFTHRTRRN